MLFRSTFFALVFSILSSAYSQEDTITISFQELRDYAIAHSPEVKIIEQKYDLKVADSKLDLQWSNPEFEYEHEMVTDQSMRERELALTVGKHITTPWVYALQRSSWKDRLKAAEFEKESALLHFLAEIKSGYATIKLIESKTELLGHFQQVIQQASKIAKDRSDEGALSGLEQQLIQMSLFNLNGRLLRIKQEQRELENEWKTNLGLTSEQVINLSTSFEYKTINIEPINNYLSLIPKTPGFKQREKLQNTMQKRIRLAQASLLPEVHVFGGYKQVNTDFKGYVLGLSLPLPIMNLNRSQIFKERIHQNFVNIEFDVYKNRLTQEIKTTVKTIQDFKNSLEQYNHPFRSGDEVIENIVFSYQEGWITLGDVLNGIQIYAESIDEYYDQLANYYRNIFEFEALVDKELLAH